MSADRLIEAPRSVAVLNEARRQVNAMFAAYQARYIDVWEPAPCPASYPPFVLNREVYPTWIP